MHYPKGYAIAAILTLALGIGTTTTVASIVDGVLLRPLPYRAPDRLVAVYETMPGNDRRRVAPANFLDWHRESRTLTGLAAYYTSRRTLGAGDIPERISSTSVSAGIFTTLGVGAKLGRTFVPADDSVAAERLVVLSDALWRRRFGASRDIVGQDIRLDDERHSVIGVMPADFRFPEPTEVWTLGIRGVPELRAGPGDITSQRDVHYFQVIGRLTAGSSQDANRELSAIAERLATLHPATNRDLGVSIVGLQEALTGQTRPILLFLMGVVGLVLLMVCANVAGLTLARSGQRQREFAIRTAIGATRTQLVRQVLVESMMLAVMGGALGVVIASVSIDALVAAAPIDLPEVAHIGIDGRLVAFSLLVAIGTGVAFGLLPAFQVSGSASLTALRHGGRGGTGPRSRLRSALVVGELALSLTLLVGAGLLVKGFVGLLRVDPGFEPDRVVTIEPALSRATYADAARIADYYTRSLERVAALPGVQVAGAVSTLPASGQQMNRGVHIEGRPAPARQADQTIEYQSASPGYFEAMAIPVRRGRGFAASDDLRAPQVAVINEAAARRYWPDVDPIGRRIGFGGPEPTWRTIVGIAGDVRQLGLDQQVPPAVYVPLLQDPSRNMTIVARTNMDPASVIVALQRTVQGVDPSQPLSSPRLMTQQLAGTLARPRFLSSMLGGFAIAALVLATLGVYGVVATAAQARTREMGIRIALGAQRADVVRMVLSGGARLALAGIALGSAGAFWFSRGVRGVMTGVESADPMVFVVTSALLAGAALLASWLPARRAAGADPMTALRAE